MYPNISNPPTSKLPPELFRTIISNFTVHADRSTLCNVALSSKLLAAESQRVLFRTTTDSLWKRNSLRKHIIYLSAIISAPTRLGPLVHAYTQTNLILEMEPNLESEFLVPVAEQNSQTVNLWQLTMLGLPAMVNLKHLHFSTRNIPADSLLRALTQCTFKLISLSWTPSGNRIDEIIEGLIKVQVPLVHLDLSYFSGPIANAVSPNLVSIRATYHMWTALCLDEHRFIRALDVVNNVAAQDTAIAGDETDEHMRYNLALNANKIRALSYSSYAQMCSEFGDSPLRHLIVLRVLTYTTMSLVGIPSFDSMRVLVLHTFVRESLSEGTVSSHLSFVFRKNTNLRYVDIQTEHTDVFQRYYKPATDAMDQRPTVKLFRANRANGMWWECHLDEADYTVKDMYDEAPDSDERSLIQNMSSLSL